MAIDDVHLSEAKEATFEDKDDIYGLSGQVVRACGSRIRRYGVHDHLSEKGIRESVVLSSTFRLCPRSNRHKTKPLTCKCRKDTQVDRHR